MAISCQPNQEWNSSVTPFGALSFMFPVGKRCQVSLTKLFGIASKNKLPEVSKNKQSRESLFCCVRGWWVYQTSWSVMIALARISRTPYPSICLSRTAPWTWWPQKITLCRNRGYSARENGWLLLRCLLWHGTLGAYYSLVLNAFVPRHRMCKHPSAEYGLV